MSLIFVPTPLGNLRDITLRAVDALRDADIIVAEDSRVSRKLLSALGISGKSVWTYHEHSGDATVRKIVEHAQGANVAVVTDAGMPGVSDPGRDLVVAARAAGVAIEVLPGPVAFVPAVVLSGFAAPSVIFEGFLPRERSKRQAAFRAARARAAVTAWYESPHRLIAALADLESVDAQTPTFVLREYTKMYEQQILGTPAEVKAALEVPVRGECALVIAGHAQPSAPPSASDVDQRIDALLTAGHSVSAVAKTLADEGLGERRHLYARASERKHA